MAISPCTLLFRLKTNFFVVKIDIAYPITRGAKINLILRMFKQSFGFINHMVYVIYDTENQFQTAANLY